MSVDTIFFRRLSLAASIGILPAEKQSKQTILIDLEFETDVKRIAQSGLIEDAIDYSQVREAIIQLVDRAHYDLLESLAELIANALLQTFGIAWLRLSISKPDIFDDMQAVGVTIERHADLK